MMSTGLFLFRFKLKARKSHVKIVTVLSRDGKVTDL